MTTPSNNSQIHDDIMAAGSQERPPMLAPVHYAQWKVQATEEQPGQPRRVEQETYANTTPESKKLIDAEAEAIHMILDRIGDDIYSTVDACSTAREIWLAIEHGESIESYYSRFYKMMNEMVRNKLKVDTMQVNVQFLQQLQPKWSIFITIVKQQQDLDTISYHRLFDILKQQQNEFNEICAEKIARNANPLALVATTQHYLDKYSLDTYYQAPKPHKTHTSSSRHTTSTSSHVTTRNKIKDIAKPVTPPSKSASKEDSDPEYAQRDKDMQKNLALIAKKPKRAKDYEYHKEKMMLCKQESKGVPLSAKHEDWLHDTNDEPDDHELEAHYMYMAKIQEVPTTDLGPIYDSEPLEKVHSDDNYNVFATERQHSEQPESINDTYVVETVDSNVTPDSSDMCDNEGQADQNAENPEDERVLLASLIANFKLDTDENKKFQKQLKKANTSLTQDLEKSKQELEKNMQDLEKRKRDLKISKQDLSYCKQDLVGSLLARWKLRF
ncbi:hypothetical protein Tco_1395608 [Tanacetum coccineum]